MKLMIRLGMMAIALLAWYLVVQAALPVRWKITCLLFRTKNMKVCGWYQHQQRKS